MQLRRLKPSDFPAFYVTLNARVMSGGGAVAIHSLGLVASAVLREHKPLCVTGLVFDTDPSADKHCVAALALHVTTAITPACLVTVRASPTECCCVDFERSLEMILEGGKCGEHLAACVLYSWFLPLLDPAPADLCNRVMLWA